MQRAFEVRAGRLAWPVPAALGGMGGIGLALGEWWGLLPLLAALVWCLLDARPALLLVALLGAGAGYGAAHLQLTRPDPLTPWIGARVTLKGHWDGQFLTTSDPRARVALSPKPRIQPGEITVSGRLERPEGQRTPGGFNQVAWLRSQGGVLLPSPSAVLVAARVRQSHTEALQGWFRRGLGAGLSQQQAALMQAIELGDRGDIGREEFRDGLSVRDAFSRAGLAHLMALSGQNVALLVGALLLLLSPVISRPAWRYGLAAVLLVVYLLMLVGVSPSITRAVVMGIAALLGLAHLMALSGQNVALLVGALLLLLSPFVSRPAWRYGLAAVLLVVYLLVLVGVSPSITRAVVMGIAALLGLALGRGKPDPLGTIALAALICLLCFPLWLLDLGFQLSFLAVLALTFSGRLADRLPERWPRALRLALSATVLAEAATLPLIASHFGQIPLVGLPANLLAELIMAVLVPLGFLAGLLGPAGALVNWLVGPLASLLLGVVQLFGHAPVLPWGQIGLAGYAAYALAAGGGVLWLLGRIRGLHALTLALACAGLTALGPVLHPPRELVFLDVGQGDATLIRLPELTMLVDAGGSVGSDYDVGGRTVVPALRALGVKKLDVVVATHADTDHMEGLGSVLRQMKVGELWIGQRKAGDPVLDALLAAANERHISVREVRRGDQITADDVKMTVLWPKGGIWSTADNDNSVALTIESHGWRTAILGDLPDPAETLLGVGHLDLLKAAHHGSRHSTSAEFLAQVRPKDALISVGAHNTYGHPHNDVLDRLQAAGVRVWRTDQLGTVRWPIP